MNVTIKAFSDIVRFLPPEARTSGWDVEVNEGSTIEQLLVQAGIPLEIPKLLTINDSNKEPDFILKDGDVLKIFPIPMGG